MNTSGTQRRWSFECNILWPGPQNNLGPAELPITVESFWINAEGLVCLVLASRSSILKEVFTLSNGGDTRACEASSDPSRHITPGASYKPNGIKAYWRGPRATTPCPARCIYAFEQLKAHACMNMQFMNIWICILWEKTMLEIVFKICWNIDKHGVYEHGLAQENIFFLYLKYSKKHM